MYQEHNNLQSTKAAEAPVTEKIDDQDQFPSNDPSGILSQALYTNVTAATGQQYSDMSGRLIQVSPYVNQYMLIIYN